MVFVFFVFVFIWLSEKISFDFGIFFLIKLWKILIVGIKLLSDVFVGCMMRFVIFVIFVVFLFVCVGLLIMRSLKFLVVVKVWVVVEKIFIEVVGL